MGMIDLNYLCFCFSVDIEQIGCTNSLELRGVFCCLFVFSFWKTLNCNMKRSSFVSVFLLAEFVNHEHESFGPIFI